MSHGGQNADRRRQHSSCSSQQDGRKPCAERTTLTSQVWKFALEELKADLDAFQTAKDALDKAITAMTGQIERRQKERRKKAAEIRELEKQTTSVQPTIDTINGLLLFVRLPRVQLAKAARRKTTRLSVRTAAKPKRR